ncbi:hypothetical protein CHU98_g3017 [Xylaria longipes]|nr:hypothetical protein CHU98_g3017 [Xylaria longipes]
MSRDIPWLTFFIEFFSNPFLTHPNPNLDVVGSLEQASAAATTRLVPVRLEPDLVAAVMGKRDDGPKSSLFNAAEHAVKFKAASDVLVYLLLVLTSTTLQRLSPRRNVSIGYPALSEAGSILAEITLVRGNARSVVPSGRDSHSNMTTTVRPVSCSIVGLAIQLVEHGTSADYFDP